MPVPPTPVRPGILPGHATRLAAVARLRYGTPATPPAPVFPPLQEARA